MAALLNVNATEQFFGASCDSAFTGVGEMIAECCTAPDSVCTSELTPAGVAMNGRSINDCIGDLDAFNNSDAAEPLDLDGTPFSQPGPADPGQCQDSKNNGFLKCSRSRCCLQR